MNNFLNGVFFMWIFGVVCFCAAIFAIRDYEGVQDRKAESGAAEVLAVMILFWPIAIPLSLAAYYTSKGRR